MTVTERLMSVGAWSLKLRDDTDPIVLDTLLLDTAMFGHIIVTPTHVDPLAVDVTLLARYAGIYRDRPSKTEFGGPGLAAWLADEDGKGDVLETALSKTAGTFVQWITDLRPSSLDAGTYNTVAGTLTHVFDKVDRRTALDYMCDFFGAEWKITPQGALSGGTQAQLFVTTPTAVVQRKSGGKDPAITGIRANVEVVKDGDDYTTRVVLLAKGPGAGVSVGTADISPAPTFKDMNGNTVEWTRIIESSDTEAGNENAVAQAQLNRFTSLRKAVTLDSDAYDIGADVVVGDSIYVWDPERNLYDLTQQIEYRGQTIAPVIQRVLGYTWPVQRGMGVYFRAPDSSGTITDLTDWVDWETGTTKIEVGAKPRTTTDTGVFSSVERPAALGPQGSLGVGRDPNLRAGVTTAFDVPNCSKQVTVGSNRRLRIIGHVNASVASGAPGFIGKIMEGATEVGRIGQDNAKFNALGDVVTFEGSALVLSPSPGAHTYKLQVARTGGAGTFDVNGNADPSYIDIVDEGPDF